MLPEIIVLALLTVLMATDSAQPGDSSPLV